jgi:hypothetical protein
VAGNRLLENKLFALYSQMASYCSVLGFTVYTFGIHAIPGTGMPGKATIDAPRGAAQYLRGFIEERYFLMMWLVDRVTGLSGLAFKEVLTGGKQRRTVWASSVYAIAGRGNPGGALSGYRRNRTSRPRRPANP